MMRAPALGKVEQRARIRSLSKAGEDPEAIAQAVGIGRRTVLAVLLSPETEVERDVADRVDGWTAACMEPDEWAHWLEHNPRNVSGGVALKPCVDCPVDFAVEMRTQDRCNGTPGPLLPGRPLRTSVSIALVPPHAVVPVVTPLAEPEERSAVSEPTADSEAIPAEPDEAARLLVLLDRLQRRALTATKAWEAKLKAADAAAVADAQWEEAQELLGMAWDEVAAITEAAPPDHLPVQHIELANGTVMRAHSDGAPETLAALRELGDVMTTKLAQAPSRPAASKAPRQPGHHGSKADETREKAARAERVMAAIARHGDDDQGRRRAAKELGMKLNALVMVAKYARPRVSSASTS